MRFHGQDILPMRKRPRVLKTLRPGSRPQLSFLTLEASHSSPVIGLLKRMNSAFIGHLLSREKRGGRSPNDNSDCAKVSHSKLRVDSRTTNSGATLRWYAAT